MSSVIAGSGFSAAVGGVTSPSGLHSSVASTKLRSTCLVVPQLMRVPHESLLSSSSWSGGLPINRLRGQVVFRLGTVILSRESPTAAELSPPWKLPL